jgi:DNA-binding MarR family transcriptional regulator
MTLHRKTANDNSTEEAFQIKSGRLIEAMRLLRQHHPDMTALQAMFLFQVAATPGITQRVMSDILDTPNSGNATRTIAILSDIGGRTVKGLGLVEMRINPEDRRERLHYLTAKGRRLINDILAVLK